MEDYLIVNGRKLRKGYTTGSCAAAAAKAAVLMLHSNDTLNEVTIDTPAGVRVTLPIAEIHRAADRVRCAVIKDGGDDPDVTTGLAIVAEARRKGGPGIELRVGEGIGTVTLPGLKVKVGEPAINPAPRRMILKEVGEVLTEQEGVEITLSVPGGAEIAAKTYNPKLGVVGGISILGTSGIVNPMSEAAWQETLALELGVLVAQGTRRTIYTFGNMGESFITEEMGLGKSRCLKIGNFVGYMLDKAAEYRLEELLIVGHLGKLVKVAAGIFQTHSRIADARMEILAAYAALEGASTDITARIYSCATTEAAAAILNENGLTGVYGRIVTNVARRCMEHLHQQVKIGAVLFHEDRTLLAMDFNAREILKGIGSDYGRER